MRRYAATRRIVIGATVFIAGGTVFGNGCMNSLLSITPCGTVFTFCTPADHAALVFPYLELPDFTADPSCTIPLGCGGQDIFPVPEGFPGGESVGAPTGGGGGAGGGFGGGGFGGGGGI